MQFWHLYYVKFTYNEKQIGFDFKIVRVSYYEILHTRKIWYIPT